MADNRRARPLRVPTPPVASTPRRVHQSPRPVKSRAVTVIHAEGLLEGRSRSSSAPRAFAGLLASTPKAERGAVGMVTVQKTD